MDAALNWLWQGCAVAFALFVLLRLLERARANLRYLVSWAALLLIAVLPAIPWLGSLGLTHEALGLAPGRAIASVPDTWWTSGELMALAWTAWASVCLVRLVWATAALRRARGRSRALPNELESLLPHWRHVRDTGRRATLVLSDAVTSAAVLGCGAPVIAVAPSLVTKLDPDELDRVLIHEWAHVQRRDDIVNVLQVLVRVVVGWHPAAWWIDRRLHVEREIACDEMTIDVTGSAKSYAACLVKLAGFKNGSEPAALAPAVLTTTGLRARVTRIVSRHTFIAPLWSRGIATAIVSVLCLVSIAVGGLTLVEATVLALPFESRRVIAAPLEGVTAVAMPASSVPSQVAPAPSPGQVATSTSLEQHPVAEERPSVTPAAEEPEEQLTSGTESAVDATTLPAPADGDADTETVPAPSPEATAGPTQLPQAAVDDSRSVWSAAADGGTAVARTSAEGGTAIGRKSKEAGVATAGFFSRFARRVAGSF